MQDTGGERRRGRIHDGGDDGGGGKAGDVQADVPGWERADCLAGAGQKVGKQRKTQKIGKRESIYKYSRGKGMYIMI